MCGEMQDAILLDCYIGSEDGKTKADIGIIRAVLPVWPRRFIEGQITHVKPVSVHKGADEQRLAAAKLATNSDMRMFERTPFGNERFEVNPVEIIAAYAEADVVPSGIGVPYFVTICKPTP